MLQFKEVLIGLYMDHGTIRKKKNDYIGYFIKL